MCTRSLTQNQPLPPDHPSPPSPATSSTPSISKEKDMGSYGAYNEPLLPASEDMKKIVGDMISMAGGVAAVLLQIAHPGVGAGVAANSSFTTRPIERGRRSIVYIYVQAFGTPAERRYITDATHKAHESINGTYILPSSTSSPQSTEVKKYDANDIDLQLWVAATTYWSLIESWEVAYGKLPRERRERIYKEFSSMGTALHVLADKWPKDLDAFEKYWNQTISELVVTPEAKEVGKLVLFPAKKLFKWRTLPAWAYMITYGPLSRVVTTEMMPESLREQFGLKSTKRTRGVYKVSVAVTKVVWPPLPMWIKGGMKNFYMWDMRRRIKGGKRW